MAVTFRLATFNCENLFARYKFKKNVDPYEMDGFSVNDLAFDIMNEAEKRITAAAIREVNADVICLQEVESLPVLDRFKSTFLPKAGYDHRVLIDCFDPRHIDIALMSRYPISAIRTYRHLRSANSTSSLFSRDCLEVDLDIQGKPFTVYVNHFKSMMDGRDETRPRRQAQVEKVAEIIKARFGTKLDGPFAVMGDLNDYVDSKTSLGALLDNPNLVNLVDRLPNKERWTHHWAQEEEYRQLDYILLPKAFDKRVKEPTPGIFRKGLPFRALKYEGERLPEVGESDPKASDHCPLFVDITM